MVQKLKYELWCTQCDTIWTERRIKQWMIPCNVTGEQYKSEGIASQYYFVIILSDVGKCPNAFQLKGYGLLQGILTFPFHQDGSLIQYFSLLKNTKGDRRFPQWWSWAPLGDCAHLRPKGATPAREAYKWSQMGQPPIGEIHRPKTPGYFVENIKALWHPKLDAQCLFVQIRSI